MNINEIIIRRDRINYDIHKFSYIFYVERSVNSQCYFVGGL